MRNIGDYHIYQRNKEWVVKKTFFYRASFISASRYEAIKRGKRFAKKSKCFLVIHNPDLSVNQIFDYKTKEENKHETES